MSIREKMVETSLFRLAKEPVRGAVRRLGYELRRTGGSEAVLSQRLLSSEAVNLVVDVGANQGQYAHYMRFLGYSGDLISFEPGSDAYRLLDRSARADTRWTTVRAALGARAGSATLNVSANSVSSSLLPMAALHARLEESSRRVRSEAVRVVTLDDQLRRYDGERRIWLKLDVQGYEGDVLAGAKETLRRSRVLQCEASVRELYEGGIDYLCLLQLVNDAGFTLAWIEPGFTDRSTGEILQFDFIAVRRSGDWNGGRGSSS